MTARKNKRKRCKPTQLSLTQNHNLAPSLSVTAGLEEARANGDSVDDETINGMRAGLMGPIAGIGDSLIVGTLIPVLLGIALGLSNGGSPVGAIFYIIVWNLLAYFGMKIRLFQGV